MTDPDVNNPRPARGRPSGHRWAALALAIAVVAGIAWWVHAAALARQQVRLLRSAPDGVLGAADLVRLAQAEGRPLYAAHCATCHGPTMQGNTAIGAPNLTDRAWLYGSGTVFDIERTVMYGIRSGMPKTHNVTDMPAFGLTGVLTPDEVRDVVQYVLQLSGRPHDWQAALAGQQQFTGTANCADCHGPDGKGDSNYGAPDLTADVWNNGGDAQSLYRTVYYGQHRTMPGMLGTLTLGQIRALAVYVYVAGHPAGSRQSSRESYVAEDEKR